MTDKENGDSRIISGDEKKPDDSRFERSALMNNDETDLALELPKRADSNVGQTSQVVKQYVSEHMDMLTRSITEDNSSLLASLAFQKDVKDSEEALLIMFVAVAFLNKQDVFKSILDKEQGILIEIIRASLISSISSSSSQSGMSCSVSQAFPGMAERNSLNAIALNILLEKELEKLTEIMLEQSVITPELISILIKHDKSEMVIGLLDRPIRPTFIDTASSMGRRKTKVNTGLEHKIRFTDVVVAMLDKGHKSYEITNLIKKLANYIETKKPHAAMHDVENDEPERTIHDELNYNELFELFIVRRKIGLLRYLFSLPASTFNYSSDHFLKALELEAYDMAALLHKEFFRVMRDIKSGQLEQAIISIVSSLNKNNGLLDQKCYLIRQFTNRMLLRHAKNLLDNLALKISQQSKQNILVLNLNPVKCSCLLIECLDDIGHKFSQLDVRCQTLRKEIVAITRVYMQRVETEAEMKYLLLEKDFENRDALDLITSYYIEEFLESQFAENVVQEMWRSAYATYDSILSASTNHALTFHYWHCMRDLEYEMPFCQLKDVNKIEAHLMQFTVWRFSPKARTLIEWVVSVIFAIMVHLLVDNFFELIPLVGGYVRELEGMEAELAAIPDKASEEYYLMQNATEAFKTENDELVLSFWNTMRWTTWVGFMVCFFFLNNIPALIYTSVTKRQFQAYTLKNVIDFAIFVFFMTYIIIQYKLNLAGTWRERQTMTVPIIRANTYASNFTNGYVIGEQYLMILCVMSLWARCFYMLRYNEYFGRLTGIVQRLIPDVLGFFLFYLIEIFFFAMVAEQAFRRLDEFNTFQKSFSTLFYASLGFFRFELFEQDTTFGEYFGLTFKLIFLAVNIGLFMSLFVSMLTTLYGEYVHKESIYQMLEKLKIRPVTQADKEFSVLISLPAPLNVILLFLAPFLFVSRNPELWNKVLLWFAYLPILLSTFTIFAVYNIALLPVTALKLFFHKMIMIFIYSKSVRMSRADKFMLWILFAVVGPFRLVSNVILDMVAFLKHCTLQDLKKTKIKISKKTMTKQNLVQLSEYFQKRNERLIPFKQVAAEVRDQMSIFQKISSMLFSADDFDTMYQDVREYSTAKAIFEGNSEYIVFKKQRVQSVDCKVMSVLFEDVLRQKVIAKVEDDNYIFIRKSVNVKDRARIDKKSAQRRRMGSEVAEYVDDPKTNVDFEEKVEAEKRNDKAVKRLTYLKTQRMLEIIGYSTTESDVRRLEYAIQQFGKEHQVFKRSSSIIEPSSLSLQGFFGTNSEKIEEQIHKLGIGLPHLDADMQRLQIEIQHLVKAYGKLQKVEQGSQSRETSLQNSYEKQITKLVKELAEVKQRVDGQSDSLTQYIKNDYFEAPEKDPLAGLHPDLPRSRQNFRQADKQKSFAGSKAARASFMAPQLGALQQPQTETKERTITLARLRRVSVLQKISNVPRADQHPGEDSDVPYLSDNVLSDNNRR